MEGVGQVRVAAVQRGTLWRLTGACAIHNAMRGVSPSPIAQLSARPLCVECHSPLHSAPTAPRCLLCGNPSLPSPLGAAPHLLAARSTQAPCRPAPRWQSCWRAAQSWVPMPHPAPNRSALSVWARPAAMPGAPHCTPTPARASRHARCCGASACSSRTRMAGKLAGESSVVKTQFVVLVRVNRRTPREALPAIPGSSLSARTELRTPLQESHLPASNTLRGLVNAHAACSPTIPLGNYCF